MKIISHRGYWQNPFEMNTESAFRRSFELGFGTETDVRDLNGELVISHDIPQCSTTPMFFQTFLEIYSDYEQLPLALNVKSNGLQKGIASFIEKFKLKNYVLFDMSIPDQIVTAKYRIKHLTRVSEYEQGALLQHAEGVWADEFHESWIDLAFVTALNEQGKSVYIVSPELHGRNYLARWEEFKSIGIYSISNVFLCTDRPEDARVFFEG